MSRPRTDAIVRFMAMCEPVTESGCWLWTGAVRCRLRPDPRPVMGVGQKRGVTAYRFAYEHFVGPIPEGLFVCHRCDVSICVNPAHLFVGTCKDNLDDMRRKGRAVVASGVEHCFAKLTEEQVRYIRESRPSGLKAIRRLASEFGVKQRAIYGVLAGKTYRGVP